MRYAIISDIHGNLEAFQSVLEHLRVVGPVEEIWCLGDLVGYGPQPNRCIDLLRGYPHCCIAGNHDWAAIGKLETSGFNPQAAAAVLWTSGQLSPQSHSYLEALPLTLMKDDFTLAHGSPRDPVWEYLTSERAALASFSIFQGRFCLVGHSHIPLRFYQGREGQVTLGSLPQDKPFPLAEGRWILNPGSVGQPRDGDPRASYILYDADAGHFQHFRVPYDIGATQRQMSELGLPPSLAERLKYGR